MLHFGGVRRCGGKRHSVSLPPPRLLKSKCTPPDMRQRKGGGACGTTRRTGFLPCAELAARAAKGEAERDGDTFALGLCPPPAL